MNIHRSNRKERLLDALARLLVESPSDPMIPEAIVVQGRGIERWLSLKLADQLGIVANVEFPFPRAAVLRIVEAAVGEGEAKGAARYVPEHLAFALLELLPAFLADPRFEDLARYLQEDPLLENRPIGARALALTQRIAHVFDGYFTYRPEMVLRWLGGEERPEERGWQPVLMRALREKIGSPTFPELAKRALEILSSESPELDNLWPRLSLFGISTLPPLYVHILGALHRHRPVSLFLLSPSNHYWADIMSQREAARELARAGWQKSVDDLAITIAHPLLGAFGRVGRDFQLVVETELDAYDDFELFEYPGRESLLTTIQSDILDLRSLAQEPSPPPPPSPATAPEPSLSRPPSPSIQFHSCHGKTRQIEALRDSLLRLLEEIPDLQPRDIIVMAPNIDELAPIIDAVFSDGDEGERGRAGFPRLPYRIADRPLSHENPIAESLLALIELSRSRMRAPEVLAFLSREPLARQFGFDHDDLGSLRAWLEETGIRWGEDAEHRASEGVPIGEEQSFREGLDRLLLGHAMRSHDRRLFAGKLGYDEAFDTRLLGAFIQAIDILFAIVKELRSPATLSVFRARLSFALDNLFDTEGDAHPRAQAVRDALARLAPIEDSFEKELEFSPEALAKMVSIPLGSASSESFASGAITFSAMVPMRSVPFRIVCLVGMDDGAFPRRSVKEGFDLSARFHRPGDRKIEDDERYLFLEALLSARDRFLVFYSGRSVDENEKLPPAPPVAELFEAVAQTMSLDGDLDPGRRRAAAEKRYLVEHPLQPFGPASFVSSGKPIETRSYDKRRLTAARALTESPSPHPAFIHRALEPLEVEALSVDDLARFFDDPALAFLEKRLGIRFRSEEDELEDRESLEQDALERWKVHDAALELIREGVESDEVEAILRARSILPFGTKGAVAAREAIRRVSSFYAGVSELAEGQRHEPIAIDMEIGDQRIVGRLGDIHEEGRLRITWAKASPGRRIGEWVRHLVYCAHDAKLARASILVERVSREEAQITRWEPLPNARELLAPLIGLWKEGMCAPLLFFPQMAELYLKELKNPKIPEEMREANAARQVYREWTKANYHTQEAPCDAPHHRRLFADMGPELFSREPNFPGRCFPDLVEMIWGPANEAAK